MTTKAVETIELSLIYGLGILIGIVATIDYYQNIA